MEELTHVMSSMTQMMEANQTQRSTNVSSSEPWEKMRILNII